MKRLLYDFESPSHVTPLSGSRPVMEFTTYGELPGTAALVQDSHAAVPAPLRRPRRARARASRSSTASHTAGSSAPAAPRSCAACKMSVIACPCRAAARSCKSSTCRSMRTMDTASSIASAKNTRSIVKPMLSAVAFRRAGSGAPPFNAGTISARIRTKSRCFSTKNRSGDGAGDRRGPTSRASRRGPHVRARYHLAAAGVSSSCQWSHDGRRTLRDGDSVDRRRSEPSPVAPIESRESRVHLRWTTGLACPVDFALVRVTEKCEVLLPNLMSRAKGGELWVEQVLRAKGDAVDHDLGLPEALICQGIDPRLRGESQLARWVENPGVGKSRAAKSYSMALAPASPVACGTDPTRNA